MPDATHSECPHYDRGCLLVAPCCGGVYKCHHCHNMAFDQQDENSHELDRFKVVEVVCAGCNHRQPKAESCVKCKKTFGAFTCLACAIWENNLDKKIYHCEACGLCRVGPASEYFHCNTCNACLHVTQRNNHTCLKETMKNNCPICLERMFDSIKQCILMEQCGHMVHADCHNEYRRRNPWYDGSCVYCRQPPPERPSVTPATLPPGPIELDVDYVESDSSLSLDGDYDIAAGLTDESYGGESALDSEYDDDSDDEDDDDDDEDDEEYENDADDAGHENRSPSSCSLRASSPADSDWESLSEW